MQALIGGADAREDASRWSLLRWLQYQSSSVQKNALLSKDMC